MKLVIMCFLSAPCYFLCEYLVSELILTSLLMNMNFIYFSWEIPNMLNMFFFYDNMSLYLILMTFWISSMMIYTISSYKPLIWKKEGGLFMIITLMSILVMMFMSLNSIFFFSMFELSVIPTLLLIIGWGYQPERIDAFFNFFYFTAVPSMPFLIYMLIYLNPIWMLNYTILNYFSSVLFFFLFSLFLVKIPIYFGHFWLPKAHVEAPVSGSMILAGILLKMGGYGLIRFIPMFSYNFCYIIIMSISAIGMFLTCIMCLLSPDLKSVIAYSSVSHMNFMIMGLFTEKMSSMFGSVVMMMSHALCSSGMFYMADLMYKRSNSRSILLNKSSMNLCPMISFYWMMLCILNMAFPFTAGNMSELYIGVTVMMTFSMMMCIILMLYFFMSAYYSMFIFYSTNHSSVKTEYIMWNIDMKETFILSYHLMPCIIMVLGVVNLSI